MTAANAGRVSLLHRLRRAEGQVRALTRMVQRGDKCTDVLVQIAAARSALRSIGLLMIENHARECMSQAANRGNDEQAVRDLLSALDQFAK